MTTYHPRIQTALVSVNPTKEHPAHHGAPSTHTVLKGVSPAIACWRPYPEANNLREIAIHVAIHENAVANRLSGQTIPAVLFIHGIAEHSLYHTAQMEMLKTLAKQNSL
jgi:hypothetical protein